MGVNQSANLRYCVVKSEGATQGTWAEPATGDFVVRIRDIEWSPDIPMDNENAKYANGSHAEDHSIAGAQAGTLTFTCRATWGGAVATVPEWWVLANACGLVTTSYTTVGRSLLGRAAYDETTYSIAIYDREIGGGAPVTTIYKFAGCIGNMQLVAANIGAPIEARFSFRGKLHDIVDGTAVALNASVGTQLAETFLSNVFTIGGAVERISSFTFDLGNEINPIIDQSDSTGYSHFVITARRPRFACNPLAKKQATRDWLNEYLSGTTGVISLAQPNAHLTLKIVKAQLISMAQAVREGLIGWDLNFKCQQNGVPGTLIDSGLTIEDTFEILQGART